MNMQTVRNRMPDQQVTLGGAVGGLMVAVVWGLNTFVLPVPMTAEVGMGLSTFVVGVVQYVNRLRQQGKL